MNDKTGAGHEAQERIRELERERDELDKAGRARDEFFSILSRELRNHIQTIGTNALLVKSRSRDIEVTRPAEAIERQVARLSKLLEDLHDVVRATRKLDLMLKPVDIQRIVSAAVKSTQDAVDAHRRELTEAHGGTIEARSAGVDKGSQFIIRIPLTDERSARAANDENTHPQPDKPLDILVVDDNRDAADSLAEVLQVYGHRVQVAYGGEEAVELSRKGGVQVALVDIGMPTVDGFEVARRISKSPASRETLLVAVTGWGAQADRARSMEAGFAYHLTKPVDYSALVSLLAIAARNSGKP